MEKVTLDTTLGELLDDPRGKALAESYVPALSSNAFLVAMAKGLSLRMALSMPQAAQFGLTQEKAEEIVAEINKRL